MQMIWYYYLHQVGLLCRNLLTSSLHSGGKVCHLRMFRATFDRISTDMQVSCTLLTTAELLVEGLEEALWKRVVCGISSQSKGLGSTANGSGAQESRNLAGHRFKHRTVSADNMQANEEHL